MAKLHRIADNRYAFHCPACGHAHQIRVVDDDGEEGRAGWTWNGSMDAPTFRGTKKDPRPSLLVNVGGANPTVPICHSVITDGKIAFIADSTHAMAGQTVDMPEWDNEPV